MLVVETISRIRRERFIHRKSIKEIARADRRLITHREYRSGL